MSKFGTKTFCLVYLILGFWPKKKQMGQYLVGRFIISLFHSFHKASNAFIYLNINDEVINTSCFLSPVTLKKQRFSFEVHGGKAESRFMDEQIKSKKEKQKSSLSTLNKILHEAKKKTSDDE